MSWNYDYSNKQLYSINHAYDELRYAGYERGLSYYPNNPFEANKHRFKRLDNSLFFSAEHEVLNVRCWELVGNLGSYYDATDRLYQLGWVRDDKELSDIITELNTSPFTEHYKEYMLRDDKALILLDIPGWQSEFELFITYEWLKERFNYLNLVNRFLYPCNIQRLGFQPLYSQLQERAYESDYNEDLTYAEALANFLAMPYSDSIPRDYLQSSCSKYKNGLGKTKWAFISMRIKLNDSWERYSNRDYCSKYTHCDNTGTIILSSSNNADYHQSSYQEDMYYQVDWFDWTNRPLENTGLSSSDWIEYWNEPNLAFINHSLGLNEDVRSDSIIPFKMIYSLLDYSPYLDKFELP